MYILLPQIDADNVYPCKLASSAGNDFNIILSVSRTGCFQ